MCDDDATQFGSQSTRPRRPRRGPENSTKNNHSNPSSAASQVINNGNDINPLIKLANPLLTLGIGLSRQEVSPDILQLKELLRTEVQHFQQQLKGFSNDLINDAIYLLCTFLDEKIMSRPWGNKWRQSPLLLEFCHDGEGGVKFFTKMEVIKESLNHPCDTNTRDGLVYLLELIYVCLSFNYGGKYKIDNQKEELGIIKTDLYHFINNFRNFSHADKPLSTHWQGTATNKIKSRWQYAVLALVVLLSLLGGMYFYYLNNLGTQKLDVIQSLDIAQADLKLINNKVVFDIETEIKIKTSGTMNKPTVNTAVIELLREKSFVFFKTSRYDLEISEKNKINSFLSKLEGLCTQLKRKTKQTIKINLLGRASSKGNFKHNQWLSEKRSQATKNYLNAQIKSCFFIETVTGEGLGTNNPISKKEGKNKAESNQSVEITVTEVK